MFQLQCISNRKRMKQQVNKCTIYILDLNNFTRYVLLKMRLHSQNNYLFGIIKQITELCEINLGELTRSYGTYFQLA